MQSDLLTPAQKAAQLGVSTMTISRWARSGRLKVALEVGTGNSGTMRYFTPESRPEDV